MIDSAGYIVTARHLVAHAGSIAVRAEGANGPIRAELVGSDPSTDIAVLKIPRDDARALQPLRLAAEGDGVRVGEPVVAVGTPFGLGGTVTAGVVSALDQSVGSFDGAIQTDAGTGPGNAGGPLVDSGGNVVGVNLAGRGSTGYAVPADTARDVIDKAQSDGDLHVPYLGMATAPLTPGLAELLGLDVEHGLLVQSVTAGGPADRAGLRGARPGRPGRRRGNRDRRGGRARAAGRAARGGRSQARAEGRRSARAGPEEAAAEVDPGSLTSACGAAAATRWRPRRRRSRSPPRRRPRGPSGGCGRAARASWSAP